MDLFLERVELRRTLRTTKPRRSIRSQRRPDRVARQTRATHQLLDRDPANEVLPAQLGPLLHVQHTPSPGLDNTIEPGSPTPRTPPPPPEGIKSQPAKEGQFLTGADKSRAPPKGASDGFESFHQAQLTCAGLLAHHGAWLWEALSVQLSNALPHGVNVRTSSREPRRAGFEPRIESRHAHALNRSR